MTSVGINARSRSACSRRTTINRSCSSTLRNTFSSSLVVRSTAELSASSTSYSANSSDPGSNNLNGQEATQRTLTVGITSSVTKLAGAICGEVRRLGCTKLEAISRPNHLKALHALTTAQQTARQNGAVLEAGLLTETFISDGNSQGKPRNMTKLIFNIRRGDDSLYQVMDSIADIDTIFERSVEGDQQLLEAIISRLQVPAAAGRGTGCIVAARGDTPVSRMIRVLCRLQGGDWGQGLGVGQELQVVPFTLFADVGDEEPKAHDALWLRTL